MSKKKDRVKYDQNHTFAYTREDLYMVGGNWAYVVLSTWSIQNNIHYRQLSIWKYCKYLENLYFSFEFAFSNNRFGMLQITSRMME